MIPLVLIAGYLGAGKTRFLTELVPQLHAAGVRVRILLNDFQNARIDAARLSEMEALVTPLDGDCVCCSSLPELLAALQDVPADPGSVLLIEANGATEADELLGHLTTDRRLGHFTLPLQLTIIDAARWQRRWFQNRLELAQTVTATHVYLNWTHRLKPERLAAVNASVGAASPRATRTTPTEFAESLVALTAAVRDRPMRRAGLPVLADAAPAARAAGVDGGDAAVGGSGATGRGTHPPSDEESHGGRGHPFASASLALPALVEREGFLRFVRELPESVVRAKGLVRFSDRPTEVFVWNRVPGRKSVQLDRSSPHAEATPVALFIGVGLPLEELAARIADLENR